MAKKKVGAGARGEIDFLRGFTDRTIFYKDTEVKGSQSGGGCVGKDLPAAQGRPREHL
jgi:hypothetical protein